MLQEQMRRQLLTWTGYGDMLATGKHKKVAVAKAVQAKKQTKVVEEDDKPNKE